MYKGRLMSQFIGKVVLRNTREIFQENSKFKVKYKKKSGETYSTLIEKRLIDYVFKKFSGREFIVEDVENLLSKRDIQERFNIPFKFGYKLHFYAQEVLVILIALNKATLEKHGRRFYYQILSERKISNR